MNVQRRIIPRSIETDTAADVARIEAIWSECRSRFGGGPFLFGEFGAADAMYAPVIWRLHTYAIEVGDTARDYMRAHMALPAWSEWRDAACREPWVLPHDEVDWPDVPREFSRDAPEAPAIEAVDRQ
jgi:glutathione S-transferase